MMPKIFCELIITSQRTNPHEITNYIGLKPTHIVFKGNLLFGDKGPKQKSHFWKMSNGGVETIDAEREIRKMFKKIKSKSLLMRSMAESIKAESHFLVAVYQKEAQGPICVLTRKMISDLRDLNLDISFDWYCLCDSQKTVENSRDAC